MVTFGSISIVMAMIYFACDEVINDAIDKVVIKTVKEAKEAKEVFDECYR